MAAELITIERAIAVHVSTIDPISRAGLASELIAQHGFTVVDEDDLNEHVVVVVVDDQHGDACVERVRSMRRRGVARVIVVASRVDDGRLFAMVEAGACGLVWREDATPERLAAAVRAAAAGEGTLPPDLVGRLLDHVGRLERHVLGPKGLTFAGITERELKVLKLLADGFDTAEVGRELFYSERTVKNIVHDVTSRLNLRNRTHAVAYALREGLI